MAMTLRPVASGDIRRIYELRNDASVRKMMFNQAEITFESHERYWKKRLADMEPLAFMVVSDGLDVGLAKLDRKPVFPAGHEAYDVGVIIDPKAQGKGLGTEAIRLLIIEAKRRGLKRLSALVMPGNDASAGIFKRNGFKEAYTAYELE